MQATPSAISELIDIIRFMTIGCLVVIIGQRLRSRSQNPSYIPMITLCLCSIAYLLIDWYAIHGDLFFFGCYIFAVLLPYSFWLFSKSIFQDGFVVDKRHGLGAIFIVFFYVFTYLLNKNNPELQAIIKFLVLMKYGLSLSFVVLAVHVALSGRSEDLISARYNFRISFSLLTAILIAFTLLSEILFYDTSAPEWLDLLQKINFFGLTFYFAINQFQFKANVLSIAQAEETSSASSKVDPQLLKMLQTEMNDNALWKMEGLTISKLAEILNVKEYRLRQTINQHLGYRNFNDYLHSYRIKEACAMLENRDQKHLTILEIAYAVGYKSIAPFNKAFKRYIGKTPTQYRTAHL